MFATSSLARSRRVVVMAGQASPESRRRALALAIALLPLAGLVAPPAEAGYNCVGCSAKEKKALSDKRDADLKVSHVGGLRWARGLDLSPPSVSLPPFPVLIHPSLDISGRSASPS
jgi:hypothetical protein